MEFSIENLNKAASTNGLIIAIISTVIGVVTYYVFPSMLGSIGFGIGAGVVSLLIYIFFTIDLKKKIGGFWNFKEALKGIFLMSFIAGIIYSLENIVFYKFVETEAFDKIEGFLAHLDKVANKNN
jgi:peptidoglycan biosynthesis protein MviN/MurJ (putative lipid II flippase)